MNTVDTTLYVYGEYNDSRGHAFVTHPPPSHSKLVFLGDIVDLCDMHKSLDILRSIFHNLNVVVPNTMLDIDANDIRDMFRKLFNSKDISAFNVENPAELLTIPKTHDSCVVDMLSIPLYTFIFGNHEVDLLAAMAFPYNISQHDDVFDCTIESHFRDVKTRSSRVDELHFTLTKSDVNLIYYYLSLCQPYLIVKQEQCWSDLYIHNWKNAKKLKDLETFRVCVCGHTRCYGVYLSKDCERNNVNGYLLMCDASHCMRVGNELICKYTINKLNADMYWPPDYNYTCNTLVRCVDERLPKWIFVKFHRHSNDSLLN